MKIFSDTSPENYHGVLLHKILQYIFLIKEDDRSEWLDEFLTEFAVEDSEEIKSVVLEFLSRNSHIEGLPEVEVLNYDNGKKELFRLDNLNITEDLVTIIDYKTGNDRVITPEIDAQLSIYGGVMQRIYPQKEVVTNVLWV